MPKPQVFTFLVFTSFSVIAVPAALSQGWGIRQGGEGSFRGRGSFENSWESSSQRRRGSRRRQGKRAKFDLDGDGKISFEETQAGWANLPERVRSKMDSNGDGTLSEEEWAAAQLQREQKGRGSRRERRQGNRQERRQERLAQFDSDGDGELSIAERQAAFASLPDDKKAKLDTNGDGIFSSEEMEAAKALRAQSRGSKRRNRASSHDSSGAFRRGSRGIRGRSQNSGNEAYLKLREAIRSGDREAIQAAREELRQSRETSLEAGDS